MTNSQVPYLYLNTYPAVKGYGNTDDDVRAFQQRFCHEWAKGRQPEGTASYLPVTSARDGKHTKGSVHPEGLAIDVGLANLYRMATVSREELSLQLYECLASLAPEMRKRGVVVILKPDKGHIHIQKTWRNIIGGPERNNFNPLLLSDTARKWIIKARKAR